MIETLVLLAGAAGLGYAASRLWPVLHRCHNRWKRPLGIVLGGLIGVALSMPLAALLNPLVGLQRATFHNLAIITMCLGFLGFCIGTLGGLVYAGMILSPSSRIESDLSPRDRALDESKPVEASPRP